MTTLRSAVLEGLTSQGLEVGEDRGGLVIRDLEGLTVNIWIDETERLVTAESPLCYPIDDFAPDLSQALDYLNRCRAGLSFSYREANRAVLATTVWSSPNWDPAPNQLHLLIGLLLQAKNRDSAALQRVAEGEASWEDVAAEVGQRRTTQTLRFSDAASESGLGTAPQAVTPHFGTETNRWTEMMGIAESGVPSNTDAAWSQDQETHEPSVPTRRLEGAALRQAAEADRGGGSSTPPPTPRREAPETPPAARRPTRHGLGVAVSQMERDRKGYGKHDLTIERRSFFRRALKPLLALVVLAAVAYPLIRYYENITGKAIDPLSFLTNLWEQTVLSEDELKFKKRGKSPAGRELLILELSDPLKVPAEHQLILDRCFAALGDSSTEHLERLASKGEPQLRLAAYKLWQALGIDHSEEGARLRLLKTLAEEGEASAKDPVTADLLNSLRDVPPSDKALAGALSWATEDAYTCLVEILGRAEDGSLERASLLQQERRKHPEQELAILEAMIHTGHPPPEAGKILLEGHGADWTRGEGRAVLLALLKARPEGLAAAFQIPDEEVRLAVTDILTEAAPRGAVELLVQVMRKDSSLKVRLRAVRGLGTLGSPEAVWHLALELNRNSESEAVKTVKEEVLSALRRFPEDASVGQLRPHLAPDRELKERHWTVTALGELHTPAAVQALVELGLQDPEERVRVRTLRILHDQMDTMKSAISRNLHVFRDKQRNDPSPAARELAGRIYQHLIRR